MLNNNEIQYEKLVINKNDYKCDESINCFTEIKNELLNNSKFIYKNILELLLLQSTKQYKWKDNWSTYKYTFNIFLLQIASQPSNPFDFILKGPKGYEDEGLDFELYLKHEIIKQLPWSSFINSKLFNNNELFNIIESLNDQNDLKKLHLNYYSKILKQINNGLIVKMIHEILNNKNNNKLIDNLNEEQYQNEEQYKIYKFCDLNDIKQLYSSNDIDIINIFQTETQDIQNTCIDYIKNNLSLSIILEYLYSINSIQSINQL